MLLGPAAEVELPTAAVLPSVDDSLRHIVGIERAMERIIFALVDRTEKALASAHCLNTSGVGRIKATDDDIAAVQELIDFGRLDWSLDRANVGPKFSAFDVGVERVEHLLIGAVKKMQTRIGVLLPNLLHRHDQGQRVALAPPMFDIENSRRTL